jgi:predicted PurR-regulated permease PerM
MRFRDRLRPPAPDDPAADARAADAVASEDQHALADRARRAERLADPEQGANGEVSAAPDTEPGEASAAPDAEPGEASAAPNAEPGGSTPLRSAPPPVVVPRWVQMVTLPLALLGLWALARAAGTVLLVLIVASMVALILAPPVRLLERRIPRGLAILLVYLACFAVVIGIGFLLVSPVSTQITRFQHNVPAIVKGANRDLADIQSFLNRHGINVHIQQQGQTALDTLQKDVLKRSGAIVSFSRDLLSGLVTVGFDLVLILVLSIYLLVYGRQIGALVRSVMPPGDGTPEDDYPLLVQHAVSGYVRGQLLFSLVMGASAALSLTVFGLVGIFPGGEQYAVFLGAFYGLMEFIPYVGPIIGPVPAVLLALFHSPISAVWLILMFIALQQLEGHIVAPQVFRISLRINPILIILSLLIGFKLYGIVGALVALPVIAVIRQTVLYLRRHLVLEPWNSGGPGVGLTMVTPDRCPDCGAQTSRGDEYCRSCGASLEPRVRSSG